MLLSLLLFAPKMFSAFYLCCLYLSALQARFFEESKHFSDKIISRLKRVSHDRSCILTCMLTTVLFVLLIHLAALTPLIKLLHSDWWNQHNHPATQKILFNNYQPLNFCPENVVYFLHLLHINTYSSAIFFATYI